MQGVGALRACERAGQGRGDGAGEHQEERVQKEKSLQQSTTVGPQWNAGFKNCAIGLLLTCFSVAKIKWG